MSLGQMRTVNINQRNNNKLLKDFAIRGYILQYPLILKPEAKELNGLPFFVIADE